VVLAALLLAPPMEQRHKEEAWPLQTLSPYGGRDDGAAIRIKRYAETTPVDLLYVDWIPQGTCEAWVMQKGEGGWKVDALRLSGPCGSNSFRVDLPRRLPCWDCEVQLTDAAKTGSYRYLFRRQNW
jgi:hypothetical protein